MSPNPGDRVIGVRVPRRYRHGFPVISVAVVALAVGVVVTDPSVGNVLLAVLTIGCLAVVWGSVHAARRARGGATDQIVLTRDGIRHPLYSVDWERVRRAWIGETSPQLGGHRALFIEPVRPSDVRWARSRWLATTRWIDGRLGATTLSLLQCHVDRPLEELLAELERRAGRPLA